MKNKDNILLSLVLILVCISRIIPHPYNFSPVGSIFLMSPLFFSNTKWSLTIAFIPLVISDILIGKFLYGSDSFLYQGFVWVYFSYFIIWFYSLKSNHNLISKSLLSSLIFFFITNGSCWINSKFYPQNFYGFLECIIAGIPFYWNTVMGFVFYTGLIYISQKAVLKNSLAIR